MKYCSKCGSENKEDAKFCMNCGTFFEESSQVSYFEESTQVVETKKSSLDKVSMILGIVAASLSVVCCCLPFLAVILGPIAIITGIIYLVKYPSANKGKAIAGIVLGAVALLIGIIIYASWPAMEELIEEAARQICDADPNSEECQIYKQTFPEWFD